MKSHFLANLCRQIVLPHNQIIMLIFTSLVTLFFGYQSIRRFRSLEPAPQLLPVTPQKVKEWGSKPTEVRVGLHIINFPEFDIVENNFVFDGIVWFEFDPALIALETMAKFSFDKGDIIRKSEPDTKLIDGKFFARYNIRVKFTTNLDYTLFPLDDHRVHIALTNQFVAPSEVMYRSYESGFTMPEGIFIAGWRPTGRTVRTGYAYAQLDKFDPRKVVLNPKIVFSLDFQRAGVQQILLIFLPLFLIFFIGLFAFAFDPAESTRNILTLSSASIASMISYRFVIQRISPTIGYFTFGDIIFTIFLGFAFAGFLFNILLIREQKISEGMEILRGFIFLLFHITFLAAWYYFLNYWV